VAVNPSDLAVALAALDATVRVRELGDEYAIPLADFHRLPGDANGAPAVRHLTAAQGSEK
jgi:CO/xanthine dehydrogenase FAD-binding subunit